MPANLTPQYRKAEEEYRRAVTPDEQLECLQVMLREIPKHKGTEKLQAEIKHKISEAKHAVAGERRTGKRSRGVRIPRQGAGTAVLLGGPNAGKSQLLAALTHATPEVAAYPFTTHAPAPGMMAWEDVTVQLIDTPPITADHLDAYTGGLVRSADLAVLVVDLGSDDGIEHCQDVLDRLNATKTRLGRQGGYDEDEIGVYYTKTLVAANKIDVAGAAERLDLLHELVPMDFEEHVISAKQGTGLVAVREAIYRAIDVVRVYTKLPSAKEADMDCPFTVRRGSTLLDLAGLIHKDYLQQFKFARVWGGCVHDATVVKGDYVLHDRDIVEIHVS